jgi:hypothetical protein
MLESSVFQITSSSYMWSCDLTLVLTCLPFCRNQVTWRFMPAETSVLHTLSHSHQKRKDMVYFLPSWIRSWVVLFLVPSLQIIEISERHF